MNNYPSVGSLWVNKTDPKKFYEVEFMVNTTENYGDGIEGYPPIVIYARQGNRDTRLYGMLLHDWFKAMLWVNVDGSGFVEVDPGDSSHPVFNLVVVL